MFKVCVQISVALTSWSALHQDASLRQRVYQAHACLPCRWSVCVPPSAMQCRQPAVHAWYCHNYAKVTTKVTAKVTAHYSLSSSWPFFCPWPIAPLHVMSQSYLAALLTVSIALQMQSMYAKSMYANLCMPNVCTHKTVIMTRLS